MINESECSCEICKSMCRRPCWGTPQEIRKLINSGYGDRLYIDYWARNERDIEILCGALKGHEGQRAPFIPSSKQGCTFWKEGLCQLHDAKLKPAEGRHAHHSTCMNEDSSIHEAIADMWDTKEGRKIVKHWKENYFKKPTEDDEGYQNSFFGQIMGLCRQGISEELMGKNDVD